MVNLDAISSRTLDERAYLKESACSLSKTPSPSPQPSKPSTPSNSATSIYSVSTNLSLQTPSSEVDTLRSEVLFNNALYGGSLRRLSSHQFNSILARQNAEHFILHATINLAQYDYPCRHPPKDMLDFLVIILTSKHTSFNSSNLQGSL